MKDLITKKKSNLDSNKKKVKFDANETTSKKEIFNLSKYISCFEFITNSQIAKIENDNLLNSLNDYSQSRYYQIKAALNAHEKQLFSHFLYSNFLQKNIDFDHDLFKCFLKTLPLRKINLFVCRYLKNFFNQFNKKIIKFLKGFTCKCLVK